MVEHHSNLLAEAARLYERHRANRPRPFNVFTVLRSASDEVNLHSRFLHALLDHLDPLSGKRENLKDFVREVARARDFKVASALVERESNHIDLLIRNEHQAIVVENKIWAGDQDQQLQRYRDGLVQRGYDAASIRLLYLTPHGHEPSSQSRGEIPAEEVELVSYRDDLRGWLIGCQRRAFDNPALRETIAQYLRLILRLTNNDYEAEHMNELKELLLRDDNVVLAGQISRSLVDAETQLVGAFYDLVDRVLHEVDRGSAEGRSRLGTPRAGGLHQHSASRGGAGIWTPDCITRSPRARGCLWLERTVSGLECPAHRKTTRACMGNS